MKFNSIVFPAPERSYSSESMLGDLVYIPNSRQGYIPCVFFPFQLGSSKILLYFHGNAEDIGLASDLLEHVRTTMRVHLLGIEYPSYGIYTREAPTEANIIADAASVFRFLVEELGVKEENILLFGRSMGSGPAVYLGSEFNPGCLILMSAYTSIKGAVASLVGRMASWLVEERFRNVDRIKKVRCPIFIVHGEADRLIPPSHAQELYDACQAKSVLNLPAEMDHNDFDFYKDLTDPLFEFFLQHKIDVTIDPELEHLNHFRFPNELYHPPEKIKELEQTQPKSSFWIKAFKKFQ